MLSFRTYTALTLFVISILTVVFYMKDTRYALRVNHDNIIEHSITLQQRNTGLHGAELSTISIQPTPTSSSYKDYLVVTCRSMVESNGNPSHYGQTPATRRYPACFGLMQVCSRHSGMDAYVGPRMVSPGRAKEPAKVIGFLDKHASTACGSKAKTPNQPHTNGSTGTKTARSPSLTLPQTRR